MTLGLLFYFCFLFVLKKKKKTSLVSCFFFNSHSAYFKTLGMYFYKVTNFIFRYLRTLVS